MDIQPIDEGRVEPAVASLGFDWHYRARTESTNADVLRHHQRHRREVVAFAETQSAGRGRRGRDWISPPGNICCSIGIYKSLPASRQGLLSVITGMALCRALRQHCGIELSLKWPNDLLYRRRKLGGILIESRSLEDGHFFFAIGFGLNVFLNDAALGTIGQPVASLHQVSMELDRSGLLIACMENVIGSIRNFEIEQEADLPREFQTFDAFHDQPVEIRFAGQTRRGINRGIDTIGQLRLETAGGIELHAAAEISLREAG